MLILYYPLLNIVLITSDPNGTNMNSLGVIWNCIKIICAPLPLSLYVTSVCVFYSFVFLYFTLFTSIVIS